MANKGIYIHIPFCIRKCNYCAFLSYPADETARENYVQALIRQIDECKEYFTLHNSGCKANFTSNDEKCKEYFTYADSIYFGGGTPSVLEPKQISRILDAVRNNFTIPDDAEITIEVNPGTLGNTDEERLSKLKAYKEMGINRLSMGVQSMDDRRLLFLGRIHNSDDVKKDYELAREAGFDNINLDLILSVPSSGNPLYEALTDVAAIVELNPEHISCYSLQIEEGTPFFEMYESGELREIPDELDREIYHKVCRYLIDHGYEQYEISNFSKPGRYSRHNSKYWDMSEYLGLGLGASSFLGGTRYMNTSNMEKYLDGQYVEEEHINTKADTIGETIFLGLRRKQGIRYDEVFSKCKENFTFKETFWKYFEESYDEAKSFEKSGHLVINDEGIRLTESGIDISNKIMALFV